MDHDTFQYLHLEYVFFNEAAHHGRLPQWLPFVTHGAPSNFWIVISQGLVASALAAVAPLLGHANFLPWFEAAWLFDELVFLLGCALLARRLYRSVAAVMFVAASLAYTTISSSQPWFNFHLFYLLPLILYCLDRAVREGSQRHLFLAGLFGAATLIGNLPYFLPLIAFTVCVFESIVAMLVPGAVFRGLRQLARHFFWHRAVALAVPLGLAWGLAWYANDGLAHTVLSLGRGAHGHVPLSNFLTYGGPIGFEKFRDLIGRYPTDRDNTIYAGILVVPFSLVAAARVRARMSYAFGATALVLALFSAGTFVSQAFYYLVPFGSYYRDIGHAAPLAKLFLTFYAGYGVEEVWTIVQEAHAVGWSGRPWRDKMVIIILLVPLALSFTLLLIERFRGTLTFASPNLPSLNYLLFLTLGLIGLLLATLRWPRLGLVLVSAVLILHGADVLWFKTEMEYIRIPRVSPAVVNLFKPVAYRFPAERTQDYRANERFVVLAPAILPNGLLPGGGSEPYFSEERPNGGVLYWTTESFLFLDSAASPFRTAFWQAGIGAFYNSWVPPSKVVREHWGFPIPASTAYRKLSGVDFPKLQLFSRIHLLQNDAAIARVLAAPAFSGDQLLASEPDVARHRDTDASVIASAGPIALRANDRLIRGFVSVQSFTLDTLRLRVDNGSTSACLLYYADAWDPGWRALVNGAPVPVFRTNLGFKSVVVPPGSSDVRFVFGDAGRRALAETTVLLSMLVIGGIVSLVLRDMG